MHRKILVALILILTIASFFRLWHLNQVPPGFYPDEAMNGNNALEALENNPPAGGWKIFYPENNGREGLFINIISGSLALFRNQPWAVRLPSAIFGILTVLGVFLFTKELLAQNSKSQETSYKQITNTNYKNSKRFEFRISNLFENWNLGFRNYEVALISSFFVATSFWHINFSRIGFRAIMAPFFLVWSLYFLHKVFRGRTSKQGASFYAAIAGLFFGLGFHTYIAFRIIPLLLIVPLVYAIYLSKKNAIHACLPCVITVFIIFFLVAISPIVLYFAQNPADFFGRATQISIFETENPLGTFLKSKLLTLGMFNVAGDHNWRHNIAGAPQLWWPIGILFLIGFVISLVNVLSAASFASRRIRLNGKRPFGGKFENYDIHKMYVSSFLLVWFALALTPTLLSFEGIPHALRSIIVIPVAYIWAAQGLWFIIEKIKNWIEDMKKRYPQSLQQLQRIQRELTMLLVAFFLATAVIAFNQYFLRWAPNQNTRDAFNENYVDIGAFLNKAEAEIPKYVVVNAEGVAVRGIPMPAQTVMFITNTFLNQNRQRKNINYILPEDMGGIKCENKCIITMLEKDLSLAKTIRGAIPRSNINLFTDFIIVQK